MFLEKDTPNFIWKNMNATVDMGLIIEMELPEISPQKRYEVYTVPGRSGEIIETFDDYEAYDYPINSVSIPYERIYEVKDWLRGSGRLITHNDPDKYRECIASFNQKNQFENEWGVFYTFDLLFRSQPFRKKVRETAIEITRGMNRYYDHGQETSQPYLEINSLGGNIDIQLNDTTLTLLNTQKGFLIVDNEKKIAFQNGTLLFSKGQWLMGKPGNNSLFINQSIGSSKLYPRSVWL